MLLVFAAFNVLEIFVVTTKITDHLNKERNFFFFFIKELSVERSNFPVFWVSLLRKLTVYICKEKISHEKHFEYRKKN